MYKSRWTRKVKGLLISFLVFVVAMMAIGIAMWVTVDAKTVKPEAELYQYFLGIRFDYGQESALDIQDTGRVTITHDYGQAVTDSSPLYYQDQERFILTAAMNFVNPYSATEAYVPIFGEFYLENTIAYYDGLEPVEILRGFLFDGSNTYIFLEPMTFKWGGRSQEVAAFSFATVSSSGSVILYDYGTQELSQINTGSYEVTAMNLLKTYTLSLSYDSVVMDNGSEQLLYTAPTYLTEIGK